VRAVRRRKVDANGVGAAPGPANLRDDPFGFLRPAAEVNKNLRARLSELEGARASHAARRAGDEGGLSGQQSHIMVLIAPL
jgi:hypothetical protein